MECSGKAWKVKDIIEILLLINSHVVNFVP